MTGGLFTPAPGAAPFGAQVRAQTRMEARLLLRNGEQLVLALVIPVLALVGGVNVAERLGLFAGAAAVDVLTPGVLALAVMSTAFTSLAIATGFERRAGVLKRLGATPLTRTGLLAGKVGALLLVLALQALVLGALALSLGWRPQPGYAAALSAAALGTAAFAALGLLLAGLLRAEATLASANLVYVLLAAGGGIVVPAAAYGALGELVRWLPSGALGESLRGALVDGTTDWPSLLALLVWAGAATALTARTFRWE